MKYDRVTLTLHFLLAFGICVQLVLGATMDAPRPGVPPDAVFQLHRLWGLGVMAVLAIHWVWQISGWASNGLKVLFPWCFAERRGMVAASLGALLRLPPREPKKHLRALAGTLQGVGLMAASLMAATGLVLFLGLAENGAASSLVAAVRHVHGYASAVVWAYLVAHISMSLL